MISGTDGDIPQLGLLKSEPPFLARSVFLRSVQHLKSPKLMHGASSEVPGQPIMSDGKNRALSPETHPREVIKLLGDSINPISKMAGT